MKLPTPMAADFARSACPVAVALDTLGNKWSLVLLRDMFAGKRRFSEFLASPEGIKRNILTERLQRLERAGLIRRVRYQERPQRFDYRLTKAGANLLPVLQAIARWAQDNVPGVWTPPDEFFAWRPDRFLKGEDRVDTPVLRRRAPRKPARVRSR
jgi:DNA-binding HxlR family transcriptional regulator